MHISQRKHEHDEGRYPRTGGVTVKLRGGMGNQLFGWACGFSVSRRTGLDLVLDSGQIVRQYTESPSRSFELDYFGLQSNSHRLDSANGPRGEGFFGFLKEHQPTLKEQSFSFDSRTLAIKAPVTLEGYFQSSLYFEEFRQEILGYLRSNARQSRASIQLRDELGQHWAVAHVRRGDYVNLQDTFSLPGAPYYGRARELLDTVENRIPLVVISDDTKVARQIVPDATRYIGPAELDSAGDILMLMSNAEAIIGANSSLSWWGAFLGGSEMRLKIFPRQWFRDPGVPLGDLFEQDWRILDLVPGVEF